MCAMSIRTLQNIESESFADELLEFEKDLKTKVTDEFDVVRVRLDIKTGEISGWKEFYE